MDQSKRLRFLDDRSMELYHEDSLIKLGRIQGELRIMQLFINKKDVPYMRTPESKLGRHYEREHRRLFKALNRG